MKKGRSHITIELNLKDHCIETELKKRYNRYVFQCLKGPVHMDELQYRVLEEKVEALKSALERFDFPHLRTSFPELRGGSPAGAVLSTDAEGIPYILVNGTRVSG